MSTKMSHAPVYLVLTQVIFNRVNNLDSYAPTIQDNFRLNGYPDSQKTFLNTLQLPAADQIVVGAAQIPVVEATNRYAFLNVEKTDGFILDQHGLTYLTSEYDVFPTFADRFTTGLKIVHDVLRLAYTERLGLRYLDAVFPNEDEELAQYLSESVLGLSKKVGGSLSHSFNETVFRTDGIGVTARTIIQNGPIGLPPDLQPPALEIAERFRSLQGLHAILDTDGSIEGRSTFAIETVERQLSSIHDEIGEVFDATVSDHARQAWA